MTAATMALDNWNRQVNPKIAEKTCTEEFVPDDRAELTPSEIVESKLLSLLAGTGIPVSCQHQWRETRR